NDLGVRPPASSDPQRPAPLAATSSGSSQIPGPGFTTDEELGAAAEALALDAIDIARDSFAVTLDWTDRSISQVESILDRMYRQRAVENPPPDAVTRVERSFGSYIGEVFRRNHGARWGMITMAGSTFPGLQSSAGQRFWPWGECKIGSKTGPKTTLLT